MTMRGVRFASLAMVLLPGVAAAQTSGQPRAEEVQVERLVIDARVVDDDGAPLEGLSAADFQVEIGGVGAAVASAQWIGGGPAAPDAALRSTQISGVFEPSRGGRLMVFVVQRSMNADRALGLLKVLQDSRRLLGGLTPADRVAVVAFDSHLSVWLDFSADLERVEEILTDEVLFGDPGPVAAAPGPSLFPVLSTEVGRRTYRVEEALQLLGEALAPLPGAKSVVLVGYGFGEFTLTLGIPGSRVDQRYERARAALADARAAVFSLDASAVDYHTFEHGLRVVAEDTGGFYARTHLVSRQALDRVAHALRGHYVLFTSVPPLGPDIHDIEVRVAGSDASVFARAVYDNRPSEDR